MTPATIDINGRLQTFYPGDIEGRPRTLVRAARFEPIYNHVRFEDEKRIGRIYDHPRLCMYLSGMVLPGMVEIENPDLEALLTGMLDAFGWNADVEVTNYMDQRVKERYIRLGTNVVESAQGFPETWVRK